METNNTKKSHYRTALIGLLGAFLLGGIGIPLGVEQFYAWKRAYVLHLIQEELQSLKLEDRKRTELQLAQCETQRFDLGQRLASISAAVDVDFER